MRKSELGEPYVTQADAGRILGVTRQSVHELVRKGRFAIMSVHGREYLSLWSVVAEAERRAQRLQMVLPHTGGDSAHK